MSTPNPNASRFSGIAKTVATVRFQVEGFHSWPEAPIGRAYLRDRHRHLFYYEVSVELGHSDREIEFHDLKDFCLDHALMGDMGRTSCEQMAEHLMRALMVEYPVRDLAVSVFEDGEVGATVTYLEGST